MRVDAGDEASLHDASANRSVPTCFNVRKQILPEYAEVAIDRKFKPLHVYSSSCNIHACRTRVLYMLTIEQLIIPSQWILPI